MLRGLEFGVRGFVESRMIVLIITEALTVGIEFREDGFLGQLRPAFEGRLRCHAGAAYPRTTGGVSTNHGP